MGKLIEKTLLVFLSVVIFGCSGESTQAANHTLDKEFEGRIKLTKLAVSEGIRIAIFTDTKTGREFLSYGESLVEIRPKGKNDK